MGVILDRFGPRIANMISICVVSLGCFTMGVSDSQHDFFLLGMVLIGFGGPGVENAWFHIANRFPNNKGRVTSFIVASFALSYSIFLWITQVYKATNWTYRGLFCSYSIICASMLIPSFFLMPDEPYKSDDEPMKQTELSEVLSDNTAQLTETETSYQSDLEDVEEMDSMWPKGCERNQTSEIISGDGNSAGVKSSRLHENIKEQDFWAQVRSPQFIKLTVFFCVMLFWANSYIGWLPFELGDQKASYHLYDVSERAHAQEIFTFVMAFIPVLGLPFIGYLMDKKGFPLTLVVILLMSIVYGICCMIPSKLSLYTGFVIYSVWRAWTFTYFFAAMGNQLGFKYFGVLTGLAYFAESIVCQLNHVVTPLAIGTCYKDLDMDECSEGHWLEKNIAQIICFILLLSIPLWDFMEQQKNTRNFGMKAYGTTEKTFITAN
eukprot:CAMPEP_0113937640 /NCGR_PEP_ID=MMETSP1339-20121228/4221_1 /TAXON_ID=94617 /ORGANISM="Fibrocapsa japonica" /LENGTH=434 /DNA_ID=CAMNT_0000940485 /DNA_START=155 /DNA_END=1459 /DNA_ORIENTATION=- /assembly_acc=CAM_ASM_000762